MKNVFICKTLPLLALLSACGSRSIPVELNPDAGGNQPDTAVPYDSGEVKPDPCIVALHLDQCCVNPVAVRASALAADPCLAQWPLSALDENNFWCKDQRHCDGGPNCDFYVPQSLSRSAGEVDGECALVDECATNADCAWGINSGECCACPWVYPKGLFEGHACVFEYSSSRDFDGVPSHVCEGVTCEGVGCLDCPVPVDGSVVCIISSEGGYNRCSP